MNAQHRNPLHNPYVTSSAASSLTHNPYTNTNPNTSNEWIVISPLTPVTEVTPENHAAYIAHLNSTNTNLGTQVPHIKKISELEIGQWYQVKAFILKTSRSAQAAGKKYLTAKLSDGQ